MPSAQAADKAPTPAGSKTRGLRPVRRDGLFLGAKLHRGGRSHRVQLMIVPRIDGRLSWTGTRAHMAEVLAGAAGLPRGRQLSAMNTEFHKSFGEPFGLGRDEVGSKR